MKYNSNFLDFFFLQRPGIFFVEIKAKAIEIFSRLNFVT